MIQGTNIAQSKAKENEVGSTAGNAPDSSSDAPNALASPKAPDAPKPPFPEPVVLDAVINSDEKPKEGPTGFKFSTPKKVHEEQAHPTKGDMARASEPPAPEKPKMTLAELDAEIKADEKSGSGGEYTYDDYRQTGEMFVEGWEALLTFFARRISKDTSESAYEFSKEKRERLIHQATKVSRKRNWVMPIEYLFVGTLLPASGAILLKADDHRREYIKKNEHLASQGMIPETNKGGPNKGTEKRRSPGRPRK